MYQIIIVEQIQLKLESIILQIAVKRGMSMSIRKKIILGVSVAFAMLVAFAIGLININKDHSIPPQIPTNKGQVVDIDNEKPTTYTYLPGEVVVKNGDDVINYNYVPGASATEDTTATTIAYQYIFGNTMDVAMAVKLKSIDTTGVNVSYTYSDTPLDTSTTITGQTDYTIQTINTKGSNKYIYILVTPTDATVPVTFSTSVVWNYGVAKTIEIKNNVNNTTTTQTFVDGLEMQQPATPTAPDGYYFDAWFLDENFTQLATFPLQSNRNLYARFHNITPNTTKYIHYVDGEYVFSNDDYFDENWCGSGYDYVYDTGITNIVIPTIYNDGINGEARVTSIGIYAFSDDMTTGCDITSVSMPCTITTIGDYAFDNSSLTSVDLTSCTNLTTIGDYAFDWCGLTSIDLTSCTNLTTIGDSAFAACDIFTSITIPSSVETIGNYAFSDCNNLISIDLSSCKNLTSIGGRAFYGCKNLQEVGLHSGITSIGDSAFYGCSSLTGITMPYGIDSIGANAFYNCVALEDINLNGCASLTSIGASAFRNCSSLYSINIPKNVTTIGANAFDSCTSLTYLVLPNELTTLGDYAFNKCSSLIKTIIPTKVTSIGKYAFYNCTQLTSVGDLSKCTDLISIGINAFSYAKLSSVGDLSKCTSLTTIGNQAFRYTTITNVVLPSSITALGPYAFANNASLIKADLSKCTSITTLPGYLFSYCSGLTNAQLPNTITNTGTYTFQYCSALSTITLPNSLTTIGSNAFYQCGNITNITIPENVTSVGMGAFHCCYNLAEVYNLSSISFEQGEQDTRNSYLAYYAGVVAKHERDESKLVTIEGVDYYKYSDTDYRFLRLSDNTKTRITLDSRTTLIRNYAFHKNQILKSIDISSCANLTITGRYLFSDCSALISVNMSGCKNLNIIDENTFSGCTSLINVDLSNCINLTTIERECFSYCDNLAYVNLTNCTSLKTIGASTFASCHNLISVNIPSSVTSIGAGAFKNCQTLKRITIPEGITTIESNTFNQCYSLTSITIPSSIISIGNNAFQYCYALAEVFNLSNLTITQGSEDNGYVGCYALQVYTSLEESKFTTIDGVRYYKESDSSYIAIGLVDITKTHVTLNDRTISINKYAFYNYTKLINIDLSNCANLVTIDKCSFYQCYNLNSITLPSSLTTIDSQAFDKCNNLVEIYNLSSLNIKAGSSLNGYVAYYAAIVVNGPRDESKLVTIDGVDYYKNSETEYVALRLSDKTKTSITLDGRTTMIGNYTFYQCINLTSVDLSKCNNLTTIGKNAFWGCSSLTSITIPSNVTKISDYAFYGCTNLKTVYNLSNFSFVAGILDSGRTYVSYYADNVYTTLP